jgi:hypothetical protein
METVLKTFDVQFIEIEAPFEKVFTFIADPGNLPRWTSAFREADENSALLVTPNGELKIGLQTITHSSGVIDWHMHMPDGSIGKAYSRVTGLPNGNVVYSFVLLAPPVPIEEIEGTLEQQKQLLAIELKKLAHLLKK